MSSRKYRTTLIIASDIDPVANKWDLDDFRGAVANYEAEICVSATINIEEPIARTNTLEERIADLEARIARFENIGKL